MSKLNYQKVVQIFHCLPKLEINNIFEVDFFVERFGSRGVKRMFFSFWFTKQVISQTRFVHTKNYISISTLKDVTKKSLRKIIHIFQHSKQGGLWYEDSDHNFGARILWIKGEGSNYAHMPWRQVIHPSHHSVQDETWLWISEIFFPTLFVDCISQQYFWTVFPNCQVIHRSHLWYVSRWDLIMYASSCQLLTSIVYICFSSGEDFPIWIWWNMSWMDCIVDRATS